MLRSGRRRRRDGEDVLPKKKPRVDNNAYLMKQLNQLPTFRDRSTRSINDKLLRQLRQLDMMHKTEMLESRLKRLNSSDISDEIGTCISVVNEFSNLLKKLENMEKRGEQYYNDVKKIARTMDLKPCKDMLVEDIRLLNLMTVEEFKKSQVLPYYQSCKKNSEDLLKAVQTWAKAETDFRLVNQRIDELTPMVERCMKKIFTK